MWQINCNLVDGLLCVKVPISELKVDAKCCSLLEYLFPTHSKHSQNLEAALSFIRTRQQGMLDCSKCVLLKFFPVTIS